MFFLRHSVDFRENGTEERTGMEGKRRKNERGKGGDTPKYISG